MSEDDDNAALVWMTFQSAAIRWHKVKARDPAFWARSVLDLAAAVHELFARGDLTAISKLGKDAVKALEASRRSRKLDPETRRRAHLQSGVKYLLEHSAAAQEIVNLIEARSPDLNVLARPEHRPVRGRIGRLTTPAERADAVKAVQSYLLQTNPEARDTGAIIERVLTKLGVDRDHARTVAGRRPRKT